jgi:MGT family glycosyltransferase
MPVPGNVRFVGPILDGPAIAQRVDHLAIGDGPDPLVLVSFSTGYQGQLHALQRVVTALGALEAKVVVTTGSSIDPAAIEAPANVMVAQFVPHDRVLPRATLVVTHAGLGTVMAALRHGVPLLCMPMGRDQFFNAAMVERLGAGRSIDVKAGADTIRDAVRSLLDDSAANAAAKNVAGIIAGYGGADDAVRELEQLTGDSNG